MEVNETTPVVSRQFTLTLDEEELVALAILIGGIPGITDFVCGSYFVRRGDASQRIQATGHGATALNGLYSILTKVLDVTWGTSQHYYEIKSY